MSGAETIDELGALEELAPAWDALAVVRAQPMSGPAWMLAWWRHLAPADAALRAIAVREGGELIGIAPFYRERGRRRGATVRYRLLADELSTSAVPLAAPGREWEVARALARALAAERPRPDIVALEPAPLASPWPLAVREGWPGGLRPLIVRHDLQSAPVVLLGGGSFEEWMARRKGKFRASLRRLARMFDEEGGTSRLSDGRSLSEDIGVFVRLHGERWRERGHSRLATLGEGLGEMLADAGAALLEGREGERGRFRLRLLEIGGAPVCADLSLAAGGHIVGFNAGWDERYSRLSPAQLAILQGVQEGFRRGDERLQLGWGGQAYKLRFADGDEPIAWNLLLPVRGRLALTFAANAPLLAGARVRGAGRRLLSEERLARLRPLVERLPR
ncbi:MAG TPA: GNAT family N-acetyltransferase [Solirubrobacteraceae bacterium]|nr:GNAT family N-acetyltransferase [Solirubrobacteraceae bacterium]